MCVSCSSDIHINKENNTSYCYPFPPPQLLIDYILHTPPPLTHLPNGKPRK